MEFNIIPTERLLLREMNPETYDFVFEHYNDDQLKKFFGFASDDELNKKQADYATGFTMFNKSFTYFQLLNKSTHEFMGWCGFHTWFIQHNRAEIGYGLNSEQERGKGYMKEALPEILQYGFETLQLHRVEALIGPDNIPSLKLVENMGFTREGQLREHYLKEEKFEDSVVFSLLKNEFIYKK